MWNKLYVIYWKKYRTPNEQENKSTRLNGLNMINQMRIKYLNKINRMYHNVNSNKYNDSVWWIENVHFQTNRNDWQ